MYPDRLAALVLAAGLLGSPGFAQAPPTQEERLATTPITSQQLRDDLHVLFGVGGNILAAIGDQGVLLVDDQFPEMVPKYRATLRELGGGEIDFVVNTHWHFDHADGNKVLGPAGTWLVSQSNSRRMLTVPNIINLVVSTREQPAFTGAALPVITFDDRMQFHFNGQQIDLLHFGPAHTTGDAAVVFRGSNVAHLGDVFNNAGYPFIDADNGGDLDGMILFCEAVLAEIDSDTIVVPGHGAVAGYADLEAYIVMLRTIRERIAALIAAGATLEEVIAANPTAEWDDRRTNSLRMVDRAYASLSR